MIHFNRSILLPAAVISIFSLSAPLYAQTIQDAVSLPAGPQTTDANDFLVLVDLKIDNYSDAARIILRTNRYFEYIDYQLQDDSGGIMFDPTEPLYTNLKDTEFDKSGLISNIKFAKSIIRQKELPLILKEGFYPLDYFAITAPPGTNYYVWQRANLLVIDIGQRRLPKLEEFTRSFAVGRKSQISASDIAVEFIKSLPAKPKAAAPSPKTKPAQAIEPAPLGLQPMSGSFGDIRDRIISKAMSMGMARMELPKDKNTFNYRECLEVGTLNFMPLVIAEEEIKLNNMKVDEAKRGLYPTATAKYTTTDGETLGVEFTEESYGMQVEQPLYYGGRLKLSLKQAQINRQVAQTKYDKAEADLVSRVTEAFYNMATAQLNLQDQQGLFNKSKEILATAQRKYQEELTTRLELLNVQSQCNQIDYQLSVAGKDLDIAKVNLLQAMGVDQSAQVFVDFALDYKERDIDLNRCILLAYQNRPELHMNELLQEVSEYDEKIAKSKDDFKVDFTGFLGESGGAYKTEPLNLGSDWYVGFKASKPWLGNVGSYSYTKNKTSPKLGQSTRTEGLSHSIEFGILNNLAGYSEKQSAYIAKLKAENELIEMEKAINLEVREAHNNYQKAVIQIQNTLEKITFREEELKVLQAQAELNEALLSQVLEAMVKLSDEKALYHQAIASYKTALANLNKAIGLVGYFE